MKNILYLILVAAIVFDFAAGAYLLHLVNVRKVWQDEIGSSLASKHQTPGADIHSKSKSKPGYAIY